MNKTGKDKRSRVFLIARRDLLNKYWDKFSAIHDQIIVMPDFKADSEYIKNDVYGETETAYIDSLTYINECLEVFEKSSHVSASNQNNTVHGETTLMSNVDTKLPRISLPRFSGNYLEWTSFKDMFLTLIDHNSNLSDVQKLHYLKVNLTGEAEQLLRNFTITEANYASAWDTLVERYEHIRVLVQTHIDSLMNIPAIRNESASELKNLSNRVVESIKALENLDRPVKHWDDWLVCMITKKLDMSTRRDWEKTLTNSDELPSFRSLQTFLLNRIRVLEIVTPPKFNNSKSSAVHNYVANAETSSTNSKKCSCCSSGGHFISFCFKFKRLSVSKRKELAEREKLCLNCLHQGHSANSCTSSYRCRICNGPHHSLLHQSSSTCQSSNSINGLVSCKLTSSNPVLLATALVDLISSDRSVIRFRALLDQGSQASFVSEYCVQRLKLPKKVCNASIYGIGGVSPGTAKGSVTLQFRSTTDSSFELSCGAIVLKKLTALVKNGHGTQPKWSHIKNLELADPEYLICNRIDIIFGADVYSQILLDGVVKGQLGEPVAQRTSLGWILSGSISPLPSDVLPLKTYTIRLEDDLTLLLRRFWEVEEVGTNTSNSSPDECYCEEFFQKTHSRDSTGRYVVRLPISNQFDGNISLGNSRNAAMKRLLTMYRKFSSDSNLYIKYSAFMNEYLSLEHMEVVSNSSTCIENKLCYLPHHCVVKEESESTKLRVVFDGSCPTSNGVSLNDRLLIGPKLQRDLSSIILNWRCHRYVFCTDIEKMFRQILVHKCDRDLQRILWKPSSSEPVHEYRLRTVTYGTSSAPYLALRVLQQLAHDEESRFPRAAHVLRTSTYVDDILSGSDDIHTAKSLQKELIELLISGGFILKKWYANHTNLTDHLPEEYRGRSTSLGFDSNNTVKTLGVLWEPSTDQFIFRCPFTEYRERVTKRSVLSDISKFFDPLGWLAPIVVQAKIFMQNLWLLSFGWDDELSKDVVLRWDEIRLQWKEIEKIRITRWLYTNSNTTRIEIHAFADASTVAYAAAIYIRAIQVDGQIITSLISAKTKVAPLKTITLPRLELCGAVLLTRLLKQLDFTNISTKAIYAWTDSMVVLGWLRSAPNRWKTFVANRVSEIQSTLPSHYWNYVPSKFNPADCASRGMNATTLKDHNLWWSGPEFLKVVNFKRFENFASDPPEIYDDERTVLTTHHSTASSDVDILERFSSLPRLLRVTAYIRRFITNSKHKDGCKRKGFLHAEEISDSRDFWIMKVQEQFFSEDLHRLKDGKEVSNKSRLNNLSPFLDKKGIIRVGGRLSNSFLSFTAKHPAIIPADSHLSKLLVRHAHVITLHGGPQLTISHLRQSYWIIRGRNLVRKIVQQCIECIRQRPIRHSQLMGNLPAYRVKPSRPFLHTGVDFAGPIFLKSWKGRGHRNYKGYVAVFVCLSTKAVHLEAVTSLSTGDFMSALTRFTSRRGICSDIYSDRGTTFVGADRELRKLFIEAEHSWFNKIAELASNRGIYWHFIPPYSPHFGGI